MVRFWNRSRRAGQAFQNHGTHPIFQAGCSKTVLSQRTSMQDYQLVTWAVDRKFRGINDFGKDTYIHFYTTSVSQKEWLERLFLFCFAWLVILSAILLWKKWTLFQARDSQSKLILTSITVKQCETLGKVMIALQLPEPGDNGRSTVQEDVMHITSFDDNEDPGSSFLKDFICGTIQGSRIRSKLKTGVKRGWAIRQMICYRS